MPKSMGENDAALYRARYTIVYPVREGETEPRTFTQYFGPYRTPGTAKSAIKTETKSRGGGYDERSGITIDTDIEVADIMWRRYGG